MSNTPLSELPPLPQVSICCLTYNHAKFVERTLNSFLSQDFYHDYEIVIGDDCSTDGTLEKLKLYESLHKNIIVISHAQHVGAGANWIEAIKSCRGKYISYCDGDDYFTTTHRLQIFYNFMELNPDCSFSFGPAYREYENSKENAVRNMYTQHEIDRIDLAWVLRRGGGFYPTSASFFKSDLIKSLPVWFNKHATGDYPLAILSILNGSIGYINELTVSYTVHSNSMTNRVIVDREKCLSRIKNNHLKNIKFFIYLTDDNIINNKTYRYLISKEDYMFFAKKFKCGYKSSPFIGFFKISYGFYFRIRLLLRFFYDLVF
jgi:glycosyltransferase involved in cell wall biosynthesis